jgi:hypothetical protein
MQRNIKIEDTRIQEDNNQFSYDVDVEVHYDIEDCESTSTCGNQEVTQSWQEVDVTDILLISYDKYAKRIDDLGNDYWLRVRGDMPKETWKKIEQIVIDESSEFVWDY